MMQTKKAPSPLKAIRKHCLDCCCDQSKEVRLCPCTDCPLYLYRFGKNPNRSKSTQKPSLSRSTKIDL